MQFSPFCIWKALGPLFTDFTWGAGGSTSELTLQLTSAAKNELGLPVSNHSKRVETSDIFHDLLLAVLSELKWAFHCIKWLRTSMLKVWNRCQYAFDMHKPEFWDAWQTDDMVIGEKTWENTGKFWICTESRKCRARSRMCGFETISCRESERGTKLVPPWNNQLNDQTS